MATRTLGVKVTANSRDFDATIDKTGAKLKGFGAEVNTFSKGMESLGGKATVAAAATQQFGRGLESGGFAGGVKSASMSLVSMASAFGPWGVAIAAAGALAVEFGPKLVAYFTGAADAADKAKKKTEDFGKAFADINEKVGHAKFGRELAVEGGELAGMTNEQLLGKRIGLVDQQSNIQIELEANREKQRRLEAREDLRIRRGLPAGATESERKELDKLKSEEEKLFNSFDEFRQRIDQINQEIPLAVQREREEAKRADDDKFLANKKARLDQMEEAKKAGFAEFQAVRDSARSDFSFGKIGDTTLGGGGAAEIIANALRPKNKVDEDQLREIVRMRRAIEKQEFAKFEIIRD